MFETFTCSLPDSLGSYSVNKDLMQKEDAQ